MSSLRLLQRRTLPPALRAAFSSAASTQSVLDDAKRVIAQVDQFVAKDGPWLSRLDDASLKLDLTPSSVGTSSKQMEIAVLSTPFSGGSDVITALLEDPLNTDPLRQNILRDRRDGSAGSVAQSLKISHGHQPLVASEGSLIIDSDFLSLGRFSILEIPGTTSLKQASSQLLLSSIPIIVVDNLRLLSHPSLTNILPSLLRHPNLRIVVNMISDLDPSANARIFQEIDHWSGGDADILETMRSRVFFVAAKRSLRAVDTYRSVQAGEVDQVGSLTVDKIEYFQNESLASNMSSLKKDLLSLAASASSSIGGNSLVGTKAVDPVVESTLFLTESALRSSLYELVSLSDHLDTFQSAASDLRAQVAQELEVFKKGALMLPTKVGEVGIHPSSDTVSGEIVKRSKENVSLTLSEFTWGKMLFGGKADDVSWAVERAIRDGWGGEGERTLVFQTGQLQQLQNQLNATTLSLVQSPPHRTLVSPVLLNSLPSTSPISPSLLLSPLQHRQAQLLAPGGPLSYLHLRAQRAVLGSYVGAASSVGLGYAGWLEGLWEVGSGAGLVGLGVLAGVRWGQGRWAKAIKKFWIDWKRVEDGLEVDLKNQITSSLDKHVFARPLAAAEGIESLVAKRQAVLATQENEVEDLVDKVTVLRAGPSA